MSHKFSSLVAAAVMVLAGCGGSASPEAAQATPRIGHAPLDASALTSTNGMSTNGMSTNGMSTNGMSTNGMSTNGMSTNGMSTNGLSLLGLYGLSTSVLNNYQFVAWYASNLAYADMVMTYIAKCAVPAGQSIGFNAYGYSDSWAGELGLAPIWAAGGTATVAEQQLVSACLGAHVNKFGVHVALSVRGYQSNGSLIPVTNTESAQFTNNEGCYFGNLFDGTGVFTAYSASSPLTQPAKTSERACAVSGGQPGQCAPMVDTNRTCESICSGTTQTAAGAFAFQNCSWNGTSYRAITVRLQDSDIATCGDGVCGASESCYNSITNTGCRADCGVCF